MYKGIQLFCPSWWKGEMATYPYIDYGSLAFNFIWELVPIYRVYLVSDTYSLKCSNTGKKGCSSWGNTDLFNICITRSVCITYKVCWLTPSEGRRLPPAPFPLLPVAHPCAVTYRLWQQERWTQSTEDCVIQSQLSTTYTDVTPLSQKHAPVLHLCYWGEKKAESRRCAELRQ